jgi:CubicO group peptidase (beta-lactamase class C family)
MTRLRAHRLGMLAAMALVVPGAWAQAPGTRIAPPDSAVDALFGTYDSAQKPGCSVAVIDDGNVVLKKSYGMADPSLGVPMTSAINAWIPYSEARVFVALAVAMLARDGKLDLDDPVRRHVPQVPAYASAVTIRQLLHHASGLADYGVLAGPGWRLEDRTPEDEMFRIMARWGKLGFVPGQGRMYSNTDYALLKILVERVTGDSLHAFLDARLLAPLGMAATRIGADQADIHPGHALSYQPDGDRLERVLRYRISPTGGISLTTSVDDLVRWDAALRDPALGLGKMLRELEAGAMPADADAEAADAAFPFGVYRRLHNGLPLIEYRGVGSYAYLVQVAGTGLSVATLCLTNRDTGWLGAEVASLYFAPHPPASGASPERDLAPVAIPGPPVQVPVSELMRYVGEYRGPAGRPRIEVAVAGNGLLLTANERSVLPGLSALGNGRFTNIMGGSTYLFEFKPAADGGMIVSSWDVTRNESGGEELSRWSPWQPEAKALTGYPGRYVGDDVDVTLDVRVDGDRVLVASRGLAESALAPSEKPDHFQGPDVYATRFERDASGRVVGLILDASRVKGMRFTRR